MKVFLTGGTGYIGSVVVQKLIQAGHDVVGLARSDASAIVLRNLGAEVYRGDVNQPDTLVAAAGAADGVIHMAFDMGSGDFAAANISEARIVDALIAVLKGSGKPFVLTSGTGVLGDTGNAVYDEETPIAPAESPVVRALQVRLAVEQSVLQADGLRGIVLRPPNVYGRGDGRVLFWMLRAAAQKLAAVPYAAGADKRLWSFVHVDDLADLFVLAIEKAQGGELFHAAAEIGLPTSEIAAALSHGTRLKVRTVALEMPQLADAMGHPAMADYWSANSQSSGEKARRVLGWNPRHLDLLSELREAGRALPEK